MRSATKTFVGLAGIGVLVATAKLGLPVTTANAATVSVATTTDTSSSQTATNTDTTASTSTTATTSTTTKTATKTTTKKTTKASTSTSSGSGTSTATPTPTPTPAAANSGTKQGQAYEQVFGSNITISVTKSNGKITEVTCIDCNATHGYSRAFPALVQATLAANGTNYGTQGNATYTTIAFKKAVKDALAKF